LLYQNFKKMSIAIMDSCPTEDSMKMTHALILIFSIKNISRH